MSQENDNTFLGHVAKAAALLIKEHQPTRTIFALIKQQYVALSDLMSKASNGEVEIIQTGSSYDDLHLCRHVQAAGADKKAVFFPLTDFDMMIVYTMFIVADFTPPPAADIDTLQLAVKQSDCAFLMVPSTHIGYVKLLVTDKGHKMLEENKNRFLNYIDKDGFLRNDAFRDGIPQQSDPNTQVIYSRVLEGKYVSAGPAISNLSNAHEGFTYDFVHTFRCYSWPRVAHRFSKRPRDANWPSKELIQEMMAAGCAVVPVGYYTSSEQHLEWRLSFNFSERMLSTAFTHNQRMCYCIVKLLLKTTLSQDAVLSSYMVKNMMYWFCEEQYGDGEWENEHLGARIVQLLEYICTALEHHNIPHYFLPFNNLIQHRSKAEVEATLNEVIEVKSKPFQTLVDVCTKMEVFEVIHFKEIPAKDLELRAIATLYLSSVTLLMKLGMMNTDSILFALDCFQTIVDLNKTGRKYGTQTLHFLIADNVPELLKPFAVQNMQNGQLDRAILLYKCMLKSDEQMVTEKFPDVLINLACLSAAKVDMVKDELTKTSHKEIAEKYFKLALKRVQNSVSLHLAHGDFLKDCKKSLTLAITEYRKACSITHQREDDDALVQMSLPGDKATSPQPQYVLGKVVAYYRLVDALVDTDEPYEGRRVARQFVEFIEELGSKQKRSALKLCAFSYQRLGLFVKASYLLSLSEKYP